MPGGSVGGHTTSVGRTHQRLDPETRRALLVEAAARVFEGRDPNEVGFEEVAAAGGVSRSLVYSYFGDRGGLIAAVYLHNLEAFDAQLVEMLDADQPGQVRLRGIIEQYLVFARDNRAAWDLMAAAGAIAHPAIQTARRARIERIASMWADVPAARLIAQAMVGLIEAGAQDWISYRDREVDEAVEVIELLAWQGLAGFAEARSALDRPAFLGR